VVKNIAIIGAGLAGLTCAKVLCESGHKVTLFDKGRGPGGRMSTRRMETPLGERHFDHGAPWFLAEDDGFVAVLEAWQQEGVTARWPDPAGPSWVGVPGMNALVRQAGTGLDVRYGVQITALVKARQDWWLHEGLKPHGPFDAVVLAIPAEQAALLAGLHDFAMARAAAEVVSIPCWTGMFAFDAPLDAPDIIADAGPIHLALRNNAKPGRPDGCCWVVQADEAWSRQYLEEDNAKVAAMLLDALQEASGSSQEASLAVAHRWRFAQPAGGCVARKAFWNAGLQLGACGDWLAGSGVEAAWLSGRDLAQRMVQGG
jgi:renalase